MGKMTLWICDKCRREDRQFIMPTGWVEATITETNRDDKEYMWCKDCWRLIVAITPTAAEKSDF